MVYGIYNELVTGANLNQLISWGPHIVSMNHIPFCWWNFRPNPIDVFTRYDQLRSSGFCHPISFWNEHPVDHNISHQTLYKSAKKTAWKLDSSFIEVLFALILTIYINHIILTTNKNRCKVHIPSPIPFEKRRSPWEWLWNSAPPCCCSLRCPRPGHSHSDLRKALMGAVRWLSWCKQLQFHYGLWYL